MQGHSEVTRCILYFWEPNISKMAYLRTKPTNTWPRGYVHLVIQGVFDSWMFKIIRRSFSPYANFSNLCPSLPPKKKTDLRANWSRIVDSGTVVTHIRCIFDSLEFQVIVEVIGSISKYPIARKGLPIGHSKLTSQLNVHPTYMTYNSAYDLSMDMASGNLHLLQPLPNQDDFVLQIT